MVTTVNVRQISVRQADALAAMALQAMSLVARAPELDEDLLDRLVDRLAEGARELGFPSLMDREAWGGFVEELKREAA